MAMSSTDPDKPIFVDGAEPSNPEFLGNLSSLKFDTEYRSLKENPAKSFYRRCLLNSTRYKRAAGYFRSTVFTVIGASIIEFSRRGGVTSLICSPELGAEDIDAITAGYAQKNNLLVDRLISEIDSLLASEETSYATRVLATLVAVGAFEIKVAIRSDRKGIYHEKIGIFSDGVGNKVSFKGSANETWSGWHPLGNFESIEVFCSWRGGLESERVRKHELHFDTLWSENDPDVEVFSFPEAAAHHLKRAAFEGLDEVVMEGISPQSNMRTALPHQNAAIAAWKAQDFRGIFEHATGSGKTFTAILALKEHANNGLPSLVLVPSRLLLEQWSTELRHEIPSAALVLAGAGHDRWRTADLLKSMTDPDPDIGGRILLATMQTASLPEFRQNLKDGAHLLFVADEVHQIGSPTNSKILEIDAGLRLGLSATPTRYGDPDGTSKIFDYFGPIIEPRITLFDAIEAGRLVPYEYFPVPVRLDSTEAALWSDLSKKISQEAAKLKNRGSSEGGKDLSERIKMLLIRRSRVAKKASGKVPLAVDILRRNYEAGQSWLVYCEDSSQLSDIRSALKESSIDSIEYHSEMAGDRDATMAWFKSYGGILVSIRCLDEGVDIPAVTHALILASSQNPRQFIQRRGRVLRKSPGKHIAVIHDAIVVPSSSESDQDQFGLLKAELARAMEFSAHSINRSAGAELRKISIEMGLDVERLDSEELEEE